MKSLISCEAEHHFRTVFTWYVRNGLPWKTSSIGSDDLLCCGTDLYIFVAQKNRDVLSLILRGAARDMAAYHGKVHAFGVWWRLRKARCEPCSGSRSATYREQSHSAPLFRNSFGYVLDATKNVADVACFLDRVLRNDSTPLRQVSVLEV